MIDLNSLLPPDTRWHLEQAFAINEAGQIAGSGTFNGQPHAFLLNTVPEPAGISLLGAGAALLFCLRKRSTGHH